jgi:CRISPR-associated protein (TIGR03984 family)
MSYWGLNYLFVVIEDKFMSENTKLHWSSQDSIKLKEAIQEPNLKNAIGLFYSPNWCKFGIIKEGIVKNLNETLNLDSVFEARIFNEECELRWLNFSGGLGKAVLLSENPEKANSFRDKNETLNYLEKLEQTYLLWGEGTDKEIDAGWSKLATARIGKLDVPIEGITRTQGVQLVSKEYLGEIDKFGNVAVVEERLIKLQSIKRK